MEKLRYRGGRQFCFFPLPCRIGLVFWDVRDSSRNKLPESRKTSFIERETVQMPANSQVDTNFDSTFSVGIEYLKH